MQRDNNQCDVIEGRYMLRGGYAQEDIMGDVLERYEVNESSCLCKICSQSCNGAPDRLHAL